jgi:hypothetical protein
MRGEQCECKFTSRLEKTSYFLRVAGGRMITPACSHIQPLLADYIDERLSAVDKAMVSSHIERCEVCQKSLVQFRSTTDALKNCSGPRVDFWKELDTQLDSALEAKIESLSWVETLKSWLRPTEQWASVTAGAILTIVVVVMLATIQPREFDVVAQQRPLLTAQSSQEIMQAYHAIKQSSDDVQHNAIHSFAPTIHAVDYFVIGQLYAEFISALLVNDHMELQNGINRLSQSLQYSDQNKELVRGKLLNIEQAIQSGQADKALELAIQIKTVIFKNNVHNPQEIEFDIGAWTVGFRYQLLMEQVDTEHELSLVESLIQRIKNQGDWDSLAAQFKTIKSKLQSPSLNAKDYAVLESAILDIEKLLRKS